MQGYDVNFFFFLNLLIKQKIKQKNVIHFFFLNLSCPATTSNSESSEYPCSASQIYSTKAEFKTEG